MFDTVSSFITAVGVRPVAFATDRDTGAVRVWKYRNHIPPGVWLQLTLAFPELTLERLEAMNHHARKQSKPPRSTGAASVEPSTRDAGDVPPPEPSPASHP